MSERCPIKGQPCTIEDCDGVACNYRSWCWKHYTAWRRHGDPVANERRVIPLDPGGEGRECATCKQMLPWSEFYEDKRDNTRRGSCRRCIQADARRRYNEDPSGWQRARRKHRLLRQFGITVEQYDEMLAAQGGKCALCGSSDDGKLLAVDHDHATGVVRALLCGMCNMTLGAIEALGSEWVHRALGYLGEHSPETAITERNEER
jgi:hypothetical protein